MMSPRKDQVLNNPPLYVTVSHFFIIFPPLYVIREIVINCFLDEGPQKIILHFLYN